MTSRPTKNVLLQVLWNELDNSVPSLLLTTDKRRYIFNCSEGLQRLFTQWKAGFGRLDAFFLTQLRWSHIGGLPGMGMTLRDIKSMMLKEEIVKNQSKENEADTSELQRPAINVYAPKGMSNIINATNNFMRFDNSEVHFNVNECKKEEKFYDDEEMSIYAIPLIDSKSRNSKSPSVCYSCHLKPLPGKFFPKKAISLGVPKGPIFAELASGKTVTLENGNEVSPDQVMGPLTPSPKFLIIDCPSEGFIKCLINNRTLEEHCKDSNFIFHVTKKEICQNTNYKDWYMKYSKVKQFFLHNVKSLHPPYWGQQDFQYALNTLNKNLFPLLKHHQVNQLDNDNQPLTNFCKVNLRRLFENSKNVYDIDTKSIPTTDWIKKANEINCVNDKSLELDTNINKDIKHNLKRKSPDQIDDCNVSKRLCEDNDNIKVTGLDFPKIVCLGTGASLPSKLRNVSSTLVLFNSTSSILFDCGEDTYGQLHRHYGDNFDSIVSTIKIILISHMHADHHLGLIPIIKKVNEINKPVTIVGPHLLFSWLSGYTSVSEELKYKFIYSKSCIKNQYTVKDGISVEAVPVNHPGMASGFVVSHNDIKVTYSGDTTPCDNLVRAGTNSTFLIHEATIEDELPEEALKRKHSTTSQALQMGKDMNAKYTILTHFSQRYPRMPILKNTELSRNVILAFDHMEICIGDFTDFHNILPALKNLLSSEKE